MIPDETYLKMVLALPEKFFENWKWQEGDTLLIKHVDSDWCIYHIGSKSENEPDGVIDGYDFNNPDWFIKNNIRPVPSQEQLQKLSGLDWDLYYHDLEKNYYEHDSAEEAGLAMLMYTKYGKHFDGEAWV